MLRACLRDMPVECRLQVSNGHFFLKEKKREIRRNLAHSPSDTRYKSFQLSTVHLSPINANKGLSFSQVKTPSTFFSFSNLMAMIFLVLTPTDNLQLFSDQTQSQFLFLDSSSTGSTKLTRDGGVLQGSQLATRSTCITLTQPRRTSKPTTRGILDGHPVLFILNAIKWLAITVSDY